MAQYTPPLRDMQFVLHELFDVSAEFKRLPRHAEVDADTINAVVGCPSAIQSNFGFIITSNNVEWTRVPQTIITLGHGSGSAVRSPGGSTTNFILIGTRNIDHAS